jgi:hypothetical protein
VSIRSGKFIGPIAKTGKLFPNRYTHSFALILEFVDLTPYHVIDLCGTLVSFVVQLGAAIINDLNKLGWRSERRACLGRAINYSGI